MIKCVATRAMVVLVGDKGICGAPCGGGGSPMEEVDDEDEGNEIISVRKSVT